MSSVNWFRWIIIQLRKHQKTWYFNAHAIWSSFTRSCNFGDYILLFSLQVSHKHLIVLVRVVVVRYSHLKTSFFEFFFWKKRHGQFLWMLLVSHNTKLFVQTSLAMWHNISNVPKIECQNRNLVTTDVHVNKLWQKNGPKTILRVGMPILQIFIILAATNEFSLVPFMDKIIIYYQSLGKGELPRLPKIKPFVQFFLYALGIRGEVVQWLAPGISSANRVVACSILTWNTR